MISGIDRRCCAYAGICMIFRVDCRGCGGCWVGARETAPPAGVRGAGRPEARPTLSCRRRLTGVCRLAHPQGGAACELEPGLRASRPALRPAWVGGCGRADACTAAGSARPPARPPKSTGPPARRPSRPTPAPSPPPPPPFITMFRGGPNKAKEIPSEATTTHNSYLSIRDTV